MFRIIFMILVFPCAAFAEQSVRQFHGISEAPTTTLIQKLESELPKTIEFATDGYEAMLSYNGIATPPPLVSFLTATFPELDTSALSPGKAVVANVMISNTSKGSAITALIQASFATSGIDLPSGSDLLMETFGKSGCNGQQIASHPGQQSQVALIYRDHLKTAGFTLENHDPNEVSYFIGRSHSCSVILYLQADPNDDDATLIVLNFAED